jgi:cation diffusion facilitator CzcD-associated flavoprotein CzcO
VPLSGNPDPKSIEELPAYVKRLHAIDLPRQTQIRERVAHEVFNPSVAEKLQSWYPSWCKRPCFHDECLPAFNRDTVTLVGTDGRGLDPLTADSIVIGNQFYPVDVIIFATGFRGPFGGTPAEKANLTITRRNGLSMSQEWARSGPTTLPGVLDHNFPNLFLSGPWQALNSPNPRFNVEALAKHSAYILAETKRRAGRQPFTMASTAAAVEDWGMQIMMRSIPMAAISGCTPSYFNLEGGLDRMPPEGQMKMERSGLWGPRH